MHTSTPQIVQKYLYALLTYQHTTKCAIVPLCAAAASLEDCFSCSSLQVQSHPPALSAIFRCRESEAPCTQAQVSPCTSSKFFAHKQWYVFAHPYVAQVHFCVHISHCRKEQTVGGSLHAGRGLSSTSSNGFANRHMSLPAHAQVAQVNVCMHIFHCTKAQRVGGSLHTDTGPPLHSAQVQIPLQTNKGLSLHMCMSHSSTFAYTFPIA